MSGTNLAVVPQDSAPAPAPASTPSPAPFYDDPDLRELEEARAAVAREAAEATKEQPPAAPPPAADPAPTQPAAPAAEIMVPKARFDEILDRMRKAEEAAAYHAGRAAAIAEQAQQPATPGQPAAPAKPPEYVEAEAIQAEWEAAAGEYDNGAISAVEFAQKQMPLLGRMLRLHVTAGIDRMAGLIDQKLAGLQAAPGIVDQQVMRQQMDALEAAHPWSKVMNEREANALVQMARAEAQALGINPYGPGPAGTMALRKRVAELATKHMPDWHPGEQPPAAAASAPAAPQPQPPAAAPSGTRPTPADYAQALARQAAHPPTAPSSHGQASGPITLDRIDTMTDAEIERLPEADRRRLLGVST